MEDEKTSLVWLASVPDVDAALARFAETVVYSSRFDWIHLQGIRAGKGAADFMDHITIIEEFQTKVLDRIVKKKAGATGAEEGVAEGDQQQESLPTDFFFNIAHGLVDVAAAKAAFRP